MKVNYHWVNSYPIGTDAPGEKCQYRKAPGYLFIIDVGQQDKRSGTIAFFMELLNRDTLQSLNARAELVAKCINEKHWPFPIKPQSEETGQETLNRLETQLEDARKRNAELREKLVSEQIRSQELSQKLAKCDEANHHLVTQALNHAVQGLGRMPPVVNLFERGGTYPTDDLAKIELVCDDMTSVLSKDHLTIGLRLLMDRWHTDLASVINKHSTNVGQRDDCRFDSETTGG
jgi:hypothetical protein